MSRYIDIHTHSTEVREGVLAVRSVLIKGSRAKLPDGLFSAGIHPWDAKEAKDEWLDNLVKSENLIAVGEIGLDFRKRYEPFEVQREWFLKQVASASSLELPVILHNVHAQEEIISVMNRYPAVTWIIHGFAKGAESARQLIVSGAYLSLGEALTESEKVVSALKSMPSDKIFFETDDSSVPIEKIYDKAASVLGMDIEALKIRIEENFRIVFPNITI